MSSLVASLEALRLTWRAALADLKKAFGAILPEPKPRFEVVRPADPYRSGFYIVDRELGREYPASTPYRDRAEALLDAIEDDPGFANFLNYFPLGSFTKESA